MANFTHDLPYGDASGPPAIIALLSDEDAVLDPRSAEVDEAYARAFEAVDTDSRNGMLVFSA